MNLSEGAKHIGEIQAWDMNTGQKVWMRTFESHNWGPVLTTGGGLVFAGGNQRPLLPCVRRQDPANRSAVAHELRHTGVPSSYAVDGVQYVAVQSGWGVRRAAHAGCADDILGSKTDVPQAA